MDSGKRKITNKRVQNRILQSGDHDMHTLNIKLRVNTIEKLNRKVTAIFQYENHQRVIKT